MTDPRPVTVLLVEDNAEFAALVKAMLRASSGSEIDVTHVDSAAEGRARIARQPVDCVILDLRLPDGRGLGLVAQFKAAAPESALIVLTGSAEELGALAVREGAQDYLHKRDVDGPGLARAIRYAVERHGTASDLRRRALRDELTGLANRALLVDRLEHALARTVRDGDSVAVVFIDLDGFKDVNDAFGHATGDRVLVDVASRLCEVVRPGDTVARWGGDEFILLCESVRSHSEGMSVADRAARAVRAAGDGVGPVSASIGVAFGQGCDTGAIELIEAADRAMYRAKFGPGDKVAAAAAGAR